MDTEPFVLVVGSINADLVVRVDRLPRPGETVTGGVFERHGGGKGANQAVAAARDGARVRFVGAVGDDDLGRCALDEVAAEGVDVDGARSLEGEATGVALVVVDAGGENQIAVAPGANRRLAAGTVERALDGIDLPEGGVLLANLEVPDEAIAAAARRATDAGMRIVLNPAPARRFDPALYALGPVLVPNRGEAAQLAGVEDPESAARELRRRMSSPVLVTLGADGVLVVDEQVERLPAFEVEAADTTGAGDTFCGVLAAGLARGLDLPNAAERAGAAAAVSVTGRGARGGMPRRAQTDAFLRERRGR